MPHMGKATPGNLPRPANGTRRAARAAVLHALLTAYPDTDIEHLRYGLGWTQKEMSEAMADLKVIAKELWVIT